jgi:hypothetical protein
MACKKTRLNEGSIVKNYSRHIFKAIKI